MNTKPLIFIDLDDTIFQTHRKSKPTPLHKIATTDKSGEPLSYMLPKQQIFVNWLFETAEVVPVTARCMDGLQRVQLPFQHGAICSHGGTILTADKQADPEWLSIQHQSIAPIKSLLNDLPDALIEYAKPFGSVRTWAVEENGSQVYAVAKQNESEPLFLSKIVENIPAEVLEHCYVHINGNNLAILPHCVSKQKAVEFFINKYDPQRERAIIGWGDSLSDAGFLACCDWFGMPKNSQLDKFLAESLLQDHQSKGYLGHG